MVKKWGPEDAARVRALHKQGTSWKQITKTTGVSNSVIARMLKGWTPGLEEGVTQEDFAAAGKGVLKRVLDQAMEDNDGLSIADLTVLSLANDPFRCDTPRGHRDARWLRDSLIRAGYPVPGDRQIHLRGLHYQLIGEPSPRHEGPYENTYDEWCWLYSQAGKAARFLGYVPFEQVLDNRNAEPVIKIRPAEPQPELSTGMEFFFRPGGVLRFGRPQAADFEPRLLLEAEPVQPVRLAMIGEKASLSPVLSPLSEEYGTDLYLPTGEISDTQIYLMAKAAAEDGRTLVVLYFADCDPAGWQMGISVGRKLQACKELLERDGVGELEFELYRVTLTPEQVRELDLPSTPLKPTERRADKWQAATGTEQTEIDALIRRPGELERLAREALDSFYDHDLDSCYAAARREWLGRAKAVLEDRLSGELEEFREEAPGKLAEIARLYGELNGAFQGVRAEDLGLPGFSVPGASAVVPPSVDPLIDSGWEFPDQCQALKDSKSYGGDD